LSDLGFRASGQSTQVVHSGHTPPNLTVRVRASYPLRAVAGAAPPPRGPDGRLRNGQRAIAARVAGARRNGCDQGRQPVHRRRDIVESPWPAAAGLADPAEFRHAHQVALGREGRCHRPDVLAVKGRSPKPSMQHNDKRLATPGGRAPGFSPAGQSHVGDVVRTRAILDGGVWRRRWPGENFSRVHGIHSGTSRHGIPYRYPDSHQPPAEVSNGCGRECLTRTGDVISRCDKALRYVRSRMG
jgi:hypothetical protein